MPVLLPLQFTGVFAKREAQHKGSEHYHALEARLRSMPVLFPMQITSPILIVPKTHLKTPRQDHSSKHGATSIGNNLFKPKVSVMRGVNFYSSGQRLGRLLVVIGDGSGVREHHGSGAK